MASVNFPASVGGDNSTVDDTTGPNGLAAGGHRTRFIPALAQLVAIAVFVVALCQTVISGTNNTSASTTNTVPIGTGSKTLVVSSGKNFAPGQFVIAADSAAPATNWMIGQVTAYSGTNLTFTSIYPQGSGTPASWSVSVTGVQGVIAGDLTAAKRVIFSGTISATIAASQNDWAPTGIGSASTIKVTASNSNLHITGLQAGVDGQEMSLWNVGATAFFVDHQSGSSVTAANRIILPGTGAIASTRIVPGAGLLLAYDGTQARWVVQSGLCTAEAADVWVGTSFAAAVTVGSIYGSLAEVALVDAATVAVDLNAGIDFALNTIGGNRTLGNPTNPKVGQTGRIRIVQDGTGGRTLAYAGNWKFASAIPPALSTAAGAVDFLEYEVITSTFIRASLTKGWG